MRRRGEHRIRKFAKFANGRQWGVPCRLSHQFLTRIFSLSSRYSSENKAFSIFHVIGWIFQLFSRDKFLRLPQIKAILDKVVFFITLEHSSLSNRTEQLLEILPPSTSSSSTSNKRSFNLRTWPFEKFFFFFEGFVYYPLLTWIFFFFRLFAPRGISRFE